MPHWLESFLSPPCVLLSAGVVVVILAAWYWLRRQPRAFRAFDTGGGEVMVTRKAVREMVQRCCEEVGQIGSASVRVRFRRGVLHVDVGLRIRRSANLKGISGYLREQISVTLTENLGVENIGGIAIVVVGILEDAAADES